MTTYYLYIKIHNKTGLRYFGYTTRNPYKYLGSGVDWTKHLEQYGNDIHTEIVLTTENKEDVIQSGRYFSNLWKITTSVDDFGNRIWANRIPECGTGFGRPRGFTVNTETKRKISSSLYGRTLSDEHKTNLSKTHLGKQHTDKSKQKISAYRTGRTHSDETKKKISETLRLAKLEKTQVL